ncbi:MAG: glycosyltransferase family 4 protein [Planctomycetes bacterium]|jgi:glycosyltransferase involved in cell wall biosynthesis|nr:glycosyltransferase family 4 protein [Planctomycetota bacterium]
MKILMLNYEFPPIGGGGGQAHLALLQRYAGRRDLEVDVLTSLAKPGFTIESFASNIRICKVGVRKKNLHVWRRSEIIEWLMKAKPRYRRLIRQGNYDLVHAFFGFPTGWLCYRTARRLPYVVSLRGSDVPGANARLKLDYQILGPLVFKPIWRRAAALVACSAGLKARALQFLPSARIDVIPNGIDLERFHPTERQENSDVLRLLTVGRLAVTKRLPLLLETVELLHGQGRAVHLTVVGGGALEAELRRQLGQRNVRGSVTLTGPREADEMPDLYRQHDVFVSASMQEGMSNAMLEAMASGLPIVTTRCEGVDELIGANGIVVEEAQASALAAAVVKLAGDRAARGAMSRAAREKAEGFGWDKVAEAYLQLYARVG